MAEEKNASDQHPLPSNLDAERALLGALMLQNSVYARVVSLVDAEDFMEPVHQQMWAAIVDLIETDTVATPITLKTYLGDADLGGSTPMQYLAKCATEATTVVNAPQYAKIIRDLAIRRKIIGLSEEVARAAREPRPEQTALALFDVLEGRLDAVRPVSIGKRTGFRSLSVIAHEAADAINDEWSGKVIRRNLMTGYAKIDDRLGGMAPGDLIVIGGRPSMGKTALAIDVAVNAARSLIDETGNASGVVGVFSLEMEDVQLVERMLAQASTVSGSKIRKRWLDKDSMGKIANAAYETAKLPIEIDQTAGMSISQIQTRARALHRRKSIKLLVIDYLQLIQGFLSRTKERNRTTELTEITAALKQLAKDLGCPIILLSQVGRQVEDREDKRPTLRDLRESGSIEQDADVVLFVYREEWYLWQRAAPEGSSRRSEWEARMNEVKGAGEVIVAKQRAGSVGPLQMGYNGKLTHWENDPPQREYEAPNAPERGKREATLPPAAEILLRDVKSMILHNGRPPTDLEFDAERSKGRQLHRNARLVDRMAVFKDWSSTRMADLSEDDARKEFQSHIDKIRKTGKLAHIGSKEEGVFFWMPELAAT